MKTYSIFIFLTLLTVSCNVYRYSLPAFNFDPIKKPNKGDVKLHTSIPYVNYFHLLPKGKDSLKSNVGFWGISVGVDYFHKENQHLNLTANGAMDFFLPVIGAVDIYGDWQFMNSFYVNATNNHHLNNWTLGYGINVSKNTWRHSYRGSWDENENYIESAWPDEEITNWAMGVTIPVYYQITDRFHLGMVYRPTFVRFNTKPAFQYEHLLSLDIAWKFNLYRNKIKD
jgi:long-subunit fatty acid transport protein